MPLYSTSSPTAIFCRSIEVQHAGDRLVEQVEVVADHQQRTAVGAQELQQPHLGVDVEVVGGLVEQQHVGAGEQDAGQLDPAPFATAEHADRQLQPIALQTKTGGHRSGLALGAIAAGGREFVLGPAVPADVALAGVFLHRDAQLLEADQLLVDAPAGQHMRDGGSPVEHPGDARVLRQVAEPALAQDLAAGVFQRSAEHPEQRGLAGAVAADQADLVARHHGERGAD